MNKKEEKIAKELLRIENMKIYEREAYSNGYVCIAGIDEAGRGPLAGPVSAGAVIFKDSSIIMGINDSKKLSAKKREILYEEIINKSIAWGVCLVDNIYIDKFGIVAAVNKAMKEAVDMMNVKADYLLIDAMKLHIGIPSNSIIKGDSLSVSIAGASIIAKVTRDRLMIDIDKQYPQYGFSRHKGYGTKEHINAILEYGPCPIHRKTFISKILQKNNRSFDEYEK